MKKKEIIINLKIFKLVILKAFGYSSVRNYHIPLLGLYIAKGGFAVVLLGIMFSFHKK